MYLSLLNLCTAKHFSSELTLFSLLLNI